MKRIIALCISIAAVMCAVTGCAAKDESSGFNAEAIAESSAESTVESKPETVTMKLKSRL